MVEALKRNERVKITIDSTIADGLAVNLAGVNTFHNLKSGILDKMVRISFTVFIECFYKNITNNIFQCT